MMIYKPHLDGIDLSLEHTSQGGQIPIQAAYRPLHSIAFSLLTRCK